MSSTQTLSFVWKIIMEEAGFFLLVGGLGPYAVTPTTDPSRYSS